jgi:hypothetical protein
MILSIALTIAVPPTESERETVRAHAERNASGVAVHDLDGAHVDSPSRDATICAKVVS